MSIPNATPVSQAVADAIKNATGATEITSVERIQSLWSGYGEILRVYLNDAPHRSVVLKHIKLPQPAEHPRGWNTDLSHQRKLKSYRVETHWYQHFAALCDERCPVPECLSLEQTETQTLLLLGDLAAAGFSEVKESVTRQELLACLSWLANFHGSFLFLNPPQAPLKPQQAHRQKPTEGLWEYGSYWHLDTRPDELAALDDESLKAAAPLIDQALNQCRYQTLIHGDAKLANFCFAPSAENESVENNSVDEGGRERVSQVAAVDFQYVGGGCGMKDVAYFLGSCLSDDECEELEAPLLDYYFQVLTAAVRERHAQVGAAEWIDELEREWRSLFDVAWADFHRFLKGWSPGHWKLNRYSERLTQRVMTRLNNSPKERYLSKSLNAEALTELCDLAKQAAMAAGQYIEHVDRSALAVEHKSAGDTLASQVVTEVDRECERIIREHLAPSCEQYALALLSEESADQHTGEIKNRFTQDYFWCVDPLDGTLPFTQSKPGYAVSIALVSRAGTPVMGVVYDPVNKDLFHAVEAEGAFKNNQPLVMPNQGGTTLTVMADHSFKDDPNYPQLQSLLQSVVTELGCDGFTEVYGNGAVKNACALLSGAPACYLKAPKAAEGGGSLWDFAATACIIKEAGGWVSDFSGQPLALNPVGSAFMNQHGVLFASGDEVARSIMRLVAV